MGLAECPVRSTHEVAGPDLPRDSWTDAVGLSAKNEAIEPAFRPVALLLRYGTSQILGLFGTEPTELLSDQHQPDR